MIVILLRDGLQLPYRLQGELVHSRCLQFLQHDAVGGPLHAQVAIILGVVEDAQIEWFQTWLLTRMLVTLMQLDDPIGLAIVGRNCLVTFVFIPLRFADTRSEPFVGIRIDIDLNIIELERDLFINEDTLILNEIEEALRFLMLNDDRFIDINLLPILLVGVVGLDLEDGQWTQVCGEFQLEGVSAEFRALIRTQQVLFTIYMLE